MIWLAVALKVPIVALLYLVWWAIKEPPAEWQEDSGGGAPDRDPGPHPRGRPPHPPRRGRHGAPEPVSPTRVRAARRPARRRTLR
jgi:hypothetical protein